VELGIEPIFGNEQQTENKARNAAAVTVDTTPLMAHR
jgi:hypothetical protein